MKKLTLIILLIISLSVYAQKKPPKNWQLLDPTINKIYGVGADQAFNALKDKTSVPVIVAVIDSGVDINHEDLKDIIWTNTKEIPGNGIDDDGNGYVDDVNGWSFLGGKNGDIDNEATELARIYYKMKSRFESIDSTKLSEEVLKDFAEYKKIKNEYKKELKNDENQVSQINIIADFIERVKKQNNGVFSKATLKTYTPENNFDKKIILVLKLFFATGMDSKEFEDEIIEGKKMYDGKIKYCKMNSDSIRHLIVGDDVNNPNEKFYGNNNVSGPDPMHGTHVSGIIAAIRNNVKGMDGIANNVKIMVVRAVPNGDERDKDIANAIRYAVDNGAKIINMSFGKYYSPDKKVIDDAVQYALSKDVLLIHAAGNESNNEDVKQSFPSRYLYSNIIATNWLEVGANSYKKSTKLVAQFSNYGKTHVDIFAPGVDIYSTLPGNKYGYESGTSMAAPSASGVAAIIRSYFPELTAADVKELLIKTAIPFKKKVLVPNDISKGKSKVKVKMSELCVAGGIINVNNAIQYLLKKKK